MLSTSRDPDAAYRPFDARANGYVPGEGGAILLVEDLETRAASAAPRRSTARSPATARPTTRTTGGEPAPDGRQFARAMPRGARERRRRPDDVDVVFADAAGMPEVDVLEAEAIARGLRRPRRELPVTAPKTMVGRLYAGGASLDVAAALLAMRDGGSRRRSTSTSRPTAATSTSSPARRARRELDTVLVNARGFGGFNSALVLRRDV